MYFLKHGVMIVALAFFCIFGTYHLFNFMIGGETEEESKTAKSESVDDTEEDDDDENDDEDDTWDDEDDDTWDDDEEDDDYEDEEDDTSPNRRINSHVNGEGQTHPRENGCVGDSFEEDCYFYEKGSDYIETNKSSLTPVPYVGMRESDINNTQCGPYSAKRSYSTKEPRFSNSYTLYDWYANGHDVPLIVQCEDGVVTDVSKYYTDKYWNGDIPKW